MWLTLFTGPYFPLSTTRVLLKRTNISIRKHATYQKYRVTYAHGSAVLRPSRCKLRSEGSSSPTYTQMRTRTRTLSPPRRCRQGCHIGFYALLVRVQRFRKSLYKAVEGLITRTFSPLKDHWVMISMSMVALVTYNFSFYYSFVLLSSQLWKAHTDEIKHNIHPKYQVLWMAIFSWVPIFVD